MHWKNNPFTQLAIQVRGGGQEAAQKFRAEVRPALEGMVRQALRRGSPPSPLRQRILQAADRLLAGSDRRLEPDPEQVIDQLVTHLCNGVIDQLQAERRFSAGETWTTAENNHFSALDSVLAGGV